MSEKMLVTQALDERDLLVKKINDKIIKAKFVDTIKRNEERTAESRDTRDEFSSKVKSAYQQINDLIARFQRLDAAISSSNAATMLETSIGRFSVASAISLRNRLRGIGAYAKTGDFEGTMLKCMAAQYSAALSSSEDKNTNLSYTAENMRASILGRDTKTRNDKPLEVVDAYVRENTTELADPLDVRKTMAELTEKRDSLLRELDTQIKVANATTFIEF